MTNLPQRIRTRLLAVLKNGAKALGIVVIVLLAVRIYKSQTGPALQPWHTWTANEMTAREIDQATFNDYLTRETAIFHDLQTDVTDTLQGNEKRRSIVTIVIARYGRAVFLMRVIARLF